MAKGKIHLAGADPWAGSGKGGSAFRYLGCTNPRSESAVAIHKDSDRITTDPEKVTCCHCRVKMAAGGMRG